MMTEQQLEEQEARLTAAYPPGQWRSYPSFASSNDEIHIFLQHAATDLAACHSALRQAWGDLERIRQEITRMRETVEKVTEYAEHTSACILSRFEEGRPMSGGGYEQRYAGIWYEVRPRNDTPACTCGLTAALTPTPPDGR